ncbi:class I SAM-dependent DNA methyltransferase [Agromyces cerinus]|uniref:Methyltransferase domain-containing protein n=1 Tax=Agromyces cerinus subsp. cerinus TaxID=232089 RepID=A0A1N6G7J4_9MICO|nr:class I SAM-dependent methyltransferase [Agromyces cerinus]SIO03488.1 Methyltransferase domain-containing protein [Agromyces cerinus subsp. cerinus]
MSIAEVREAYTGRAEEYISLLGSVADTHELDRDLISRWAEQLDGPVLDAGCGPGHWTDHLRRLGRDVEGVDLVPAFVARARERFPEVPFRVATFDDLGVADAALGGILAWYSLIHLEPERVPSALSEFARCIRPGGSLLLGFFDGASIEPFPHKVVTAYFWPPSAMTERLEAAGFAVEAVHTRSEEGTRPHAAIVARRIDAGASAR